MSNYVQTTFFTPKDSLPPSNPAKTIFGAAYDVEFGNISSAIASKYDSSSISAGPIAFALGSAAAPSVTFLGELGTGLYSNVSGDLGHATAGTARLTISGSTGLTTALAGLTVSGGTTTTAALSSTTGNFSQNVVIGAPSSGTPLTLNTSASGSNFLTVSDGTQSGAILSQSGSIQFGAISNSALFLLSNNINRVQIASNGTVTINTPSSSSTVALTVNGASGNDAIYIQASSNVGSSYGMRILAGTNSSDIAFRVLNQAGTTAYLQVFGDGGIQVGAPTSGNLGLGTVNATGLYVNGGPIYSGIPQNSQSASYVTVLADANKHIYHPTTDNNARTFTIAANSSVAYPIGTAITFDNDVNVVTLAINTDTLVWLPTGATGSRSIAAQGQGTALKVTATRWHLTGVGIT